ncbi:MAG: OsmC family protein [Candidatus Korobacteraceae bacterium]
MPDYRYYASATWTDGRKGTVSAGGIADLIRFSAPPEFMGEAGTWTPEHFFAAAIASCFVTTFKAIAEFSKFEFLSLQVEVEAILEKEEGGFSFTKVVLQPLLQIAAAADQERAIRLLEKAEHACLISRSVKSQIELQPEVIVRTVDQPVAANA